MIDFTFNHTAETVALGTKITVTWKKKNEDLCSKTAIVTGDHEAYIGQLARECRAENAELFIDETEQLENIDEIQY